MLDIARDDDIPWVPTAYSELAGKRRANCSAIH